MKLRWLGNTGIKVSEICFGTMTFGGQGYWGNIGKVDQQGANKLVEMALEAGINFFDTADVYSQGISEEILGKALGDHRKDIILATKVRGRTGPGPNDIGLSRRHIIEGCNASLRRLGTDYIDLYQVHSFDPVTPLEETLDVLSDLVHQGKVRYIGCSNFTGWQLMKALAISTANGFESFVTLQAYYSLVGRDLELELVPLCQDQKLGILPWSPLAGGFLTGKFRRGQKSPEGARRSVAETQFIQFDENMGYAVIDELEKIAKAHNATITQAALNYLLRKPSVNSVIIGARNPEQLSDSLKAGDWEMTSEEIARLDELSKPPHLYPHWFLEAGRQNR
ncbi:MAG TPA: aldo/keto reductase [candidate division Zixibacteria bacterium]|nr:aldo/keto reductase [candidate division Zixibacteria bacterium]